MQTDYCTYPPQITADVEITPQREGDRQSFIVGSVSVGRFILLRETEDQVLHLLDEAHTPATVCAEFSRQHAATLSLPTLTRFLTKLDEVGILAGVRTHRAAPDDPQASARFYYRLPLFNPERLFVRIVTPLRDDYGGRGVLFGHHCSESEWDAALNDALRGNFVVQELIDLHTEEFPIFNDREWHLQPMFVDTNPFLFRGKVDGVMVRLADTPVVNVTSGGGETGFFVLEED